MRSAQATALVAGREVTERARSRSFIVATVILAVLAVAAVVLPGRLSSDAPHSVRMGVVGAPAATLTGTIRDVAGRAGAELHLRSFADRGAAESALRAERVDLVVALDAAGRQAAALLIRGEGTADHVRSLSGTLARVLRAKADLAAEGVSPEHIGPLLVPRALPVKLLVPLDPELEEKQGVLLIATVIPFMSLLTYGTWVGMGVVAEKSSRVAEVILATIRPSQLLAGKVIGIGLVGLAQLVIVAVAALLASLTRGGDLPAVTPGPLSLVVLWFVLGFAFYSCAFAAVGASVARQEDAQTALGPVTTLLTISYFVGVAAVTDPEAGWIRLVSFVPPLAPMTMPARMVLTDTSWWELPAGVVIMIVSTYGLIRLSARLYSGAILRFGTRTRLRDAWRAGRQEPSVATQGQP